MGDSWRGTRRRTLHQRVARRAQFGYPCSTDVGRVGRASGAGSSFRPSRRRVSLRCPRIQLRGKRTSDGRTGVPRRISGGGGAGVGGVRVRGFRGCRRPALMSAMAIGRFPGPDAGSDFESLDDGCAESVWPGSAHATFWPVAAAIPTPTATTARPKRRGARLPRALRRACTAINPLWHSVVVSRTSRRRGPADRRTRCRQHMTTCDINLRFVAESPVSSPFQDRCFLRPDPRCWAASP